MLSTASHRIVFQPRDIRVNEERVRFSINYAPEHNSLYIDYYNLDDAGVDLFCHYIFLDEMVPWPKQKSRPQPKPNIPKIDEIEFEDIVYDPDMRNKCRLYITYKINKDMFVLYSKGVDKQKERFHQFFCLKFEDFLKKISPDRS